MPENMPPPKRVPRKRPAPDIVEVEVVLVDIDVCEDVPTPLESGFTPIDVIPQVNIFYPVVHRPRTFSLVGHRKHVEVRRRRSPKRA